MDNRVGQDMRLAGPTGFGFLLVGLFFFLFGGWAALAPLSRGAVASGVISVESHRTAVEHLEGGLVAEILVAEGEQVSQGSPLMRLDGTQAQATQEMLTDQYLSALSLEARLIAERDKKDQIVFPVFLTAQAEEARVKSIVQGQESIFYARHNTIVNQSDILERRIGQFHEEISGLQAENRALETQLSLVEEELDGVKDLYKKGLARKPQVLALRQKAAELQGRQARNLSSIARSRQNIAESELRIHNLTTVRHNEVVQQLQETRQEVAGLAERLRAAQDILTRITIVAPVSGQVVNLKPLTPGSVLNPGETVMDIVPSQDRKVIDARLRPLDVDVVYAGLPAQIRLSALNRRTTPVFEGRIERVSADALTDPRTGEAYYTVQVLFTDFPSEYHDLSLHPGMPAEVLIVTGSSTTLEYLLRPFLDSFHRAMRDE
ncbi:MAG: HlyD family type I secretion periplasmic adaptor subunit [Magnetococcales bacterium]|nr:HlyD family type I secretion periplasmic adaptor subunit [Magnetococcales bacterium]